MVALILTLLGALRSGLHSRPDLALQTLPFASSWPTYGARSSRPRLHTIDRAFWLVLSETRRLIRQMAEANVGWGAPRIHGELLKLGSAR